jgi:hypothetical protein
VPNYSTEDLPVIRDQKEFAEAFGAGRLVFFVGSGVSIDSGLPSATMILNRTAEHFLPAATLSPSNRDLVLPGGQCSIQPEVFYEDLLYLCPNAEVLNFWASLSETHLAQYGFRLAPSASHRAIVSYSIRHRVPIFTTNFDSLFEAAAENAGIPYERITPFGDDQERVLRNLLNEDTPRTLHIFKLHGSIESKGRLDLSNLQTTMTSITRINLPVLSYLARLLSTHTLAFAGYSGRDVDYFPELCERARPDSIVWLDPFTDMTKVNAERIHAVQLRIPDHREHGFRPMVNTDSGIVNTDSGHREHGFRSS